MDTQLDGPALEDTTNALLKSPSDQLSLYNAIQACKYEHPKLSDLSSYSSWSLSTLFFLRSYFDVLSGQPLVTTVDDASQRRQLEFKVYTCLVDGSEAQLLFANKGDLYDGKGFEMVGAINNHFSPCDDMVTFEILHDLPNNRQGTSEPVTSYQSRLEGMFLRTSSLGHPVSSKLQVMLFVIGLRAEYKPLIDRFRFGELSFDSMTMSKVSDLVQKFDRAPRSTDTPIARSTAAAAHVAAAASTTPSSDQASSKFKTLWEWIGALKQEEVLAFFLKKSNCVYMQRRCHNITKCQLLKKANLTVAREGKSVVSSFRSTCCH